ncbi:MAG: substrate-binding domain-containing protein, partial [Candidatus Omnitrophota bacterium]
MIYRITLAMFLLISSLVMGISRAEELKGSIQIKGSDTMVNLAQAWAEEFSKNNPGVNAAVTGGGSGTGIAAMIAGTADIAISSRTMKEKEINKAKQNGIEPFEIKTA